MGKQQKTTFEMEVVSRVREMRIKKGFTQENIATILSLSIGFIGQIESKNSPSTYNLNHLNRLAYEMDCLLSDFIPINPIFEENWKDE